MSQLQRSTQRDDRSCLRLVLCGVAEKAAGAGAESEMKLIGGFGKSAQGWENVHGEGLLDGKLTELGIIFHLRYIYRYDRATQKVFSMLFQGKRLLSFH